MKKKSNRRGVLLLVVLALLAMFAMVAVAFVVLAGGEKRIADRMRTIDAVQDSPEKTLNQGLNVALRGAPVSPLQAAGSMPPPTSAIVWCNLLEKIDGFERIGTPDSSPIGTQGSSAMLTSMSRNSLVCNGQLIEFTLPPNNPDVTLFGNGVTGNSIDRFQYVGCVLTMLDGPNAGLSTRIVGINPNNGNVQMVAFDGGALPAAGNNYLNGNHYIVNGFPYNGMGFGFTTSGGSLSGLALLPNSPPSSWGTFNGSATGGTKGIIAGGVNSDYTAADFQDPLVALAVPNPNSNGGIIVPIPSLHRSDLIAYANTSATALQLSAAQMRQVMFRPVGQNCCTGTPDHPLFTGSNPNFNPLWDGNPATNSNGYAWDVDNDGDGIADSVWVDLGLPVRYTTDGRAYKPLFAILCLDMDSRLNLNAHGTYAQTQGAYYWPSNNNTIAPSSIFPPVNLQSYVPLSNPQESSGTLDVGIGGGTSIGSLSSPAAYFAAKAGSTVSTPPIALPRGQGSGTAEVNLLPLFRNSSGGFKWTNNHYQAQYQALLSGGTETLISGGTGAIMGRYGPLLTPNQQYTGWTPVPPIPSAGIGGALPGSNGSVSLPGSPLTLNTWFPYNGANGGSYWSNFQNPVNNPSNYDAYGSPPDSQAIGAIGLDRAGRPLYISLGGPVANGPYDIDLTRNAPHAVNQATVNNPFGVAELECILRPYDCDAATLPQRLAYLTNNGNGSVLQSRRAEITTESWWVPVASAVLPPALRASLPKNRSMHPVDLVAAKMGGAVNNTALNTARMQLLPWEILQGLKMDLNRPFGAGAFSLSANYMGSVNGGSPTIPDQPGTTGGHVPQMGSGGLITPPPQFNYSADAGAVSQVNGTAVNNSLAARQLYARHLYVLALALSDTGAILQDLQKSTTASVTSDDVTRLLAQWAVNVVAYRDHNGIMIPFPYDPNPFSGNGWGSSNGFNTPQYTVWGCKRPELLITETLAFHDRRTQDLSNEVFDSSKKAVEEAAYPSLSLTWLRTAAGLTSAPQKSGSEDYCFNSGYRPQGSLFVELYNPWTVKEPRTADLSGVDSSGVAGVQLNKKTPAVNGQSSPVWRLAIVDPSLSQNAPPTVPPSTAGDELPDPDNPNVTKRPKIERVAYFVPLSGLTYPSTDDLANPVVSYYSSIGYSGPMVVAPSGYAVVGSGEPKQNHETFIGFEQNKTAGNPISSPMITMSQTDPYFKTASVVQNMNYSQPLQPPPSGPPLPRVLGIDQAIVPPSIGPGNNGGAQRLSISEPTKGYYAFELDGSGNRATCDPTTGQYTEGGKSVSLDIPVDQQRSNTIPSRANPVPNNPPEVFKGIPIWQWLNNNGTIPAFRIIYLQRLADPTRPFVAENNAGNANPPNCNPYRTVDAMTVDLTTFNGVTTSTADKTVTNGAVSGVATPLPYHFEAHQRGEKNYLPGNGPTAPSTVGEASLWKQEPAYKGPGPAGVPWIDNGQAVTGGSWTGGGVPPKASCCFTINGQPFTLNQTLGYLNQPFQPTGWATTPSTPAGDPQYPFPWLNFSYRPFNNEYELLLVPMVSSSKLLARQIFAAKATTDPRHYFSYVDGATRANTNSRSGYQPQDVYDPPSSGRFPSQTPTTAVSNQVPYPHLLNFFESTPSSKWSQPGQAGTGLGAQLSRIFAYVGVPSRFANVQLQMRADLAGSGGAHYFHTPFNRISRYREPGRINLNMLTSADVLFGAMNIYFSPLQTNSQLNPIFWDKFVRSRRGDGYPGLTHVTNATPSSALTQRTLTNMLSINPKMPSRFMCPYRTPGGEFLSPIEPARETDVSLLRGDPDGSLRPLYELDDGLILQLGGSTSSPTATPDNFSYSYTNPTPPPNNVNVNAACMDYNRNPYFRYQAIQKLGNVVSNHSNVFAIWITVGYFEVLPNPNGVDAGHPDGWQLGPELGSDSGDIVRHRAFYIFDRSIPVGFVRGQDINQDKALLLKRFIE